jgi:ABC-type bacteriocin/lantibiotic exporter with double-glycine peptidase domain
MGVEVRGEEILNRFSIGSEGVPLRDVAEVLGSYKPSAAAVKIQDRDLGVVPIPAILILRNSHCVVYEGFSEEDGRVRVFDPTTAAVEKWESDVVRDEWSGQAIVFEPIWRLSKLSLGAVSLLTAVITFGGLRWGVRLLARGVQKAIK